VCKTKKTAENTGTIDILVENTCGTLIHRNLWQYEMLIILGQIKTVPFMWKTLQHTTRTFILLMGKWLILM
jgi:hypothetical protein